MYHLEALSLVRPSLMQAPWLPEASPQQLPPECCGAAAAGVGSSDLSWACLALKSMKADTSCLPPLESRRKTMVARDPALTAASRSAKA